MIGWSVVLTQIFENLGIKSQPASVNARSAFDYDARAGVALEISERRDRFSCGVVAVRTVRSALYKPPDVGGVEL